MTTAPIFKKAVRRQAKLRLAIEGPSGSGKTWTSLCIARGLVGPEGRIALIDTERGSAALYSDAHDFDVLELHDNFSPDRYHAAIRAAEGAGYDVIVIDSLSHSWEAAGGIQEIADRNKKGGNTWSGWAAATPAYRALVDAMLGSPLHVIATMRTKTEWAEEKDERGKVKYQKVGTAPVMRAGIDYEFTIVCDMDLEHNLEVTKSRYSPLAGRQLRHPGQEIGVELAQWLAGGAPVEPTEAVPQEAAQQGGGTSPASAPASSSGGESAAPPEPGPQPVDWQVRLLSEASLPVNPLTRAGSNGVLKALGIRVYNELAHGERMRSAVTALRERFPDALSARYARVEVPIASRSKPGHEHLVVLSRAGAEAKAECPCEGFRFAHACRHVPMAWSSLAFSWLTNETPSPREAWEGIDVDKLAGVARAADEELEPQGSLPTGGPPAEEEKPPRVCVACGEPWNGIGSRCEACLDVPAPKTPAGSAA